MNAASRDHMERELLMRRKIVAHVEAIPVDQRDEWDVQSRASARSRIAKLEWLLTTEPCALCGGTGRFFR